MKKFTLVLALFCLVTTSFINAQTGSGWEWATTSGVNNYGVYVKDIVTDATGNVYASGDCYDSLKLGSFSFTAIPGEFYGKHAFVAKYDNAGNVLWLKRYSDILGSVQIGTVIAVDASGNVYMGGSNNSTNGSPGHGYVAKFNGNNGSLIWSKIFTLFEVIGINIGPDGNPIVIESIPGAKNIYKLNQTDGSTLWTVTNTGTSIITDTHDNYNKFLDAAGNIYYNVGGTPYGGANTTEVLAGQTFINPATTAYIVSLNNNGITRWVDSIPGSFYNNAPRVVVTNAGKMYVIPSYYYKLGGTNQPLTTAASYYELNNLGQVTLQQASGFPFPGYTGERFIIKDDGLYTINNLRGGNGLLQAYGNYFIASPPTNLTTINWVVKYDLITHAVIWVNSFETTGSTPFDLSSSFLALDVTTAGKVVVGGSYGLTIKFGTITKTYEKRASVYGGVDCYVAQFDGNNVAAAKITTWTGAANDSLWTNAANWNNGAPTGIEKSIIPAGLTSYPTNIVALNKTGMLVIDNGVNISLPLDFKAPGGIINNGAITLIGTDGFQGFNYGQTSLSGNGKLIFTAVGPKLIITSINNGLEINSAAGVTISGASITGSLLLTKGLLTVFSNSLYLTNPNASVTYNATSYVVGNLKREVNTSGIYYFPVGNANGFGVVKLSLNNINGPTNITASFTNTISGVSPNTTAQGISVTSLLNSGIWTISPNVALTGGSYDVTLEGRGFTNSITDATRYVVLKRANSSSAWAFFGNNGIATYSATAITATAGNITGFSDFAIGIATATVPTTLPVKLINFEAKADGNTALLSWQTATEINNEKFEIEHSINATNWLKIGEVKGNGLSNATKNYTYRDGNITNGSNYYRLKQIDLDGKFEYSNVVIVNYSSISNNQIRIYPNPATDFIYIKGININNTYVKIVNTSGKIVLQKQLTSDKLIIPTSLPNGLYLLQVIKDNEINNLQIMKSK